MTQVRSLSGRHLIEVKGKFAQALSGGGEDGVANAGPDQRKRRLADTAGWAAAFHQVGLEVRSVRHAQYFRAIEVLLLNHSVLDRDALFKGGAQAHQHSALYLGTD